METVKYIADQVNGIIWDWPDPVPLLVILLLGTGVFLTLRMRVIQLRKLGHALDVIRGRYDNPDDEGDISHFQALAAALSATIGIGNIAGVATAIHYGGPGALFWMWLTALFGMASKYVECTLSMRYRRINPDGSASGGPMYYIEQGLGPKWKPLAVLFAVCAVVSSFGSGNGVQAFTVADSFRADFGVPPWLTGLVSATLVGLVIVGGIRRIGAVASRIVPFMSVLYVAAGTILLVLHYDKVPDAIALIVREAFTPRGGVGGFAGSTFTLTLIWGVKRGLFSNEAGQGSAPIAHAAAKTTEPVREGLVAMTGPFIDTLIICTVTGLAIVTTGTWLDKRPDDVHLASASGVTVLALDMAAGTEGRLDGANPVTGTLPIEGGRPPDGHHFVRNHATVDDPIVRWGDAPFEGTLEVREGAVVAAFRVGADGPPPAGLQAIPQEEVRLEEVRLKEVRLKEVRLEEVRLAGAMSLNGSPLTAASFQRGLSPIFPWGNLLVTFCVALFAISTAISWSYYGDRSIEYLLGPRAVMPYRVVFTVVHFLGAVFSLEVVWSYADAALGMMAIPNLIAMILLSGTVVRMTRDYLSRPHQRYK